MSMPIPAQYPEMTADDIDRGDAVAEIATLLQHNGMPGMAARAIASVGPHDVTPTLTAVAQAIADGVAADAAGLSADAPADAVLIPSAQRRASGAPRFLLAVPCAAMGQGDLQTALREELGPGTEIELRAFLDAILSPGDAYLDADPGFGFAPLTAATHEAGDVAVVTRGADADHVRFLSGNFARNGAAASAVALAPDAAGPASVDAMAAHPLATRARRLVVHVGQARDLPVVAVGGPSVWGDPRLAAVAMTGADRDPAARTWLARRGLELFAVAQDAGGTVLVPAEAMPEATLLVGLSAAAVAGAEA